MAWALSFAWQLQQTDNISEFNYLLIFGNYKVSTKIFLTQSIFPNLELEILNAKPHADLLSV